MARRYRKSRKVSQRQYRSRLAKYSEYASKTLDPVSFKEWNAPYREKQFLRKQYKIYIERFEKRKESAKYGFRLKGDESNQPTEAYSYRDFKEQYLLMRNTLKAEVEMGERERVGSVITEIINDQAYELSSNKARVIADYLLREHRELLIKKGLVIPDAAINEKGEPIDYVKARNLRLIIRQGQFVAEEVGLWDEIKEVYKALKESGKTAREAINDIGKTYFESDPKKRK